MKEHSLNQKKAVNRANVNQSFFQEASKKGPFFKPEDSMGASFFLPLLNPYSTQIQRKKNENLPEDLQEKIENSFGQDFSNVNIQKNSKEAIGLNARAFTKGDSIHFAPSEFNPNSEKGKNLIGHEFTHVTQQRSGVVKPTSVMGEGLNLNNDRGLESEADYFGQKAVRGESIPKYQSSSLGIRNNLRVAQAKSNIIQRAVTTWGGIWDTGQYDLRKDKANGKKYPPAAGVRGVDIKLKFTPGANADAELIGLTQSVQGIVNNKLNLTAGAYRRHIKGKDAQTINTGNGETDEGTAIDRASGYNNPIYAVDSQPSASLSDTNISSGWGQHGYRKKNAAGKYITKDAKLFDSPTRGGAAKNSRQIFETTALATKGVQAGTYYGSVRWGWRTDSSAKFTKLPLQVVSQGVPSSTFMKAAEIWNASTLASGTATLNLPIVDVKVVTGSPITLMPPPIPRIGVTQNTTLPIGTRLQVIRPWRIPMALNANGEVRVVDGPHVGKQGEVSSQDWLNITDERS